MVSLTDRFQFFDRQALTADDSGRKHGRCTDDRWNKVKNELKAFQELKFGQSTAVLPDEFFYYIGQLANTDFSQACRNAKIALCIKI